MTTIRFRKFIQIFALVAGIFAFVWISKVIADEVYNFYFQKGNAPQTVIQGGGGQSADRALLKSDASAPQTNNNATASEPSSSSAPKLVETATDLKENKIEKKERNPFAITVGYGAISDDLVNEETFTLGVQYNFNPFLGARLQGRLSDSLGYYSPEGYSPKSMSGMAAFVLTPIRLNLFGHRLLDVAVNAGTEVYRRGDRNNNLKIAPMLGASALLSLNENFGIELLLSKSTRASFIGASVAFMF